MYHYCQYHQLQLLLHLHHDLILELHILSLIHIWIAGIWKKWWFRTKESLYLLPLVGCWSNEKVTLLFGITIFFKFLLFDFIWSIPTTCLLYTSTAESSFRLGVMMVAERYFSQFVPLGSIMTFCPCPAEAEDVYKRQGLNNGDVPDSVLGFCNRQQVIAQLYLMSVSYTHRVCT